MDELEQQGGGITPDQFLMNETQSLGFDLLEEIPRGRTAEELREEEALLQQIRMAEISFDRKKVTDERYRKSERGRETAKAWRQSERGRELYAHLRQRPENQEYQREYQAEYRQRPGQLEHLKEYQARYRADPENRRKQKERLKEWDSKPENLEKRREYSRNYQKRKREAKQAKPPATNKEAIERLKQDLCIHCARPECSMKEALVAAWLKVLEKR